MSRRRPGETAGSGLGSARGVSLSRQGPIPQAQAVTVQGRPAVLNAARGGVGWGCREPPFHRQTPLQPSRERQRAPRAVRGEGCVAAQGPGSGLHYTAPKPSPTQADPSHCVLSVSCQRSRGRLLPKSSLRKKRRENALPKARRQRWLQQRQRNLQVAKKKNTAR